MPTVIYTGGDGVEHITTATNGESVMETAVGNGVPGIVGQCGGSLACASCHVYVDEDWRALTGTVSEMEDEMLDGALAERLPESRLSCQLTVCEELDGLRVRIAPEQL